MSRSSQTFKVRFGSHPVRATVTEPAAATDGSTAARAPNHAHRTALYLVIAHRIDELLRAGKLKSYADAAEWLGISTARTNMISHLMLLAAPIQNAILCGDARLSEHRLRDIARIADWNEQIAAVIALEPSLAHLTLKAGDETRSSTPAAMRRTAHKDAP